MDVVVQLLSHIWFFATPWAAACQISLSCTISQSLLKLKSSLFPASVSFPMGLLFSSGSQYIWGSALGSVLPVNIQGWFPLGLTCCLRDYQEYYLPSQFRDISSSVLSPLYGPPLKSIHDYWKNHSFEYKDRCRQSDVFLICSLGLS